MRNYIISQGGTFFLIQFIDLETTNNSVSNVIVHHLDTDTTEKLYANVVILVIGHSSRDTFKKVYEKGLLLEPKNFSVGVRIEHLQSEINKCSPLRQVYLSPRGGYTLDRVDEGKYRVVLYPDQWQEPVRKHTRVLSHRRPKRQLQSAPERIRHQAMTLSPSVGHRKRWCAQAMRAIVLRNRASARLNSTAPMPSSHTSDGHTTAQPAPL